jgi:hypothetical protein
MSQTMAPPIGSQFGSDLVQNPSQQQENSLLIQRLAKNAGPV